MILLFAISIVFSTAAMLFLQNIPTSQKVTLRKLLDKDSAERMNHPLIRYTNPGIRFDCENETLENQILDTYFLSVNPFISELGVDETDTIIRLFNQWSPQHFYQIYQRIQKLANRVKHFNAIHNFGNLLVSPILTIAPQVMEYMLHMNQNIPTGIAGAVGASELARFHINDFHYTCAVISDNLPIIQWMDSVSPITSHGIGKYVYLILLHGRIPMFQWISTKYPDHIQENKNTYRNYAVQAKMTAAEVQQLFG